MPRSLIPSPNEEAYIMEQAIQKQKRERLVAARKQSLVWCRHKTNNQQIKNKQKQISDQLEVWPFKSFNFKFTGLIQEFKSVGQMKVVRDRRILVSCLESLLWKAFCLNIFSGNKDKVVRIEWKRSWDKEGTWKRNVICRRSLFWCKQRKLWGGWLI